jgi:hypothetical protein
MINQIKSAINPNPHFPRFSYGFPTFFAGFQTPGAQHFQPFMAEVRIAFSKQVPSETSLTIESGGGMVGRQKFRGL